ncbi:11154_t:CDS:2 [Dentiscutata heterogama]|uniref:11154_t:CDS:1 n=1 Tax=Dentiscutata heterogama TaxID=1316150 RepID=A0ACA9M8J9_9GLOM|nr:11154_t:CDS:2 [Dentiscutata heterogama]
MDPLVENLLKTSLDDEDPTRSPHLSDNSDISEDDSSKIENGFDDSSKSFSLLQHGGRQTGPKGVLADHEYHKQYTKQQKAASIAAYNERMLSKALTTTTYREDELNKSLEEDLKDLENITLREISSNQYVKAIDDEAPDSIPQCKLLNECLTHLAKKFVHSKFLRILAHDLDFDPIGLPALLVYKNGKLIANLVKITDEIGETNFDSNNIEEILLRHGALNVTESIGE